MKTKEEILRLTPNQLNSEYYMQCDAITPTHAIEAMESYAMQKVAECKKNIWFDMFNDRHPDEVKEILSQDFLFSAKKHE